MITKEDSTCFT